MADCEPFNPGTDDTNHTTDTNVGEGWRAHKVEEGRIQTGEDLSPVRDDGTIDLDLHCKAAFGNHTQGCRTVRCRVFLAMAGDP